MEPPAGSFMTERDIGLTVMDAHINDDSFVDACVDQLITFMEET